MAGNLLGPRRWYAYTADNGNVYSYLTDQDLGTAIGATLDDTNETLPSGLRPRGVYCTDASGNKKFVIAPTTSTTQYADPGGAQLSIDDVTFNVNGIRGEKRRVPNNPTTPAP